LDSKIAFMKLKTKLPGVSPYLPSKEVFGLGEVAAILKTEEWRIKNFVDGKAFGIRPTAHAGTRTRRLKLFDGMALVRLGIALELTESGFLPKVIGEAMELIKDEDLRDWVDYAETLPARGHIMLTRTGDEWELLGNAEVEKRVNELRRGRVVGVYMLRLSALAHLLGAEIHDRLVASLGDKK